MLHPALPKTALAKSSSRLKRKMIANKEARSVPYHLVHGHANIAVNLSFVNQPWFNTSFARNFPTIFSTKYASD